MSLKFVLVKYGDLNARQKENYNYQKLSALLADYGFVTMRLSSDWRGADLIAQHIDGDTFLKIQLKSRFMFCRKYVGKDLYIAFRRKRDWYLYPHDELLEKVDASLSIKSTLSWTRGGEYSFVSPTKSLFRLLDSYQIEHSSARQTKLRLHNNDDPRAKTEEPERSALDVAGINLNVSIEEIVEIVREGREKL